MWKEGQFSFTQKLPSKIEPTVINSLIFMMEINEDVVSS
jgi:hypothetical protein